MERLYENLLGVRPGMERGMEKAEALREAQKWLRELTRKEARDLAARQNAVVAGAERGEVRQLKPRADPAVGSIPDHPYSDPYFWAAFILIGDTD